MLQPGLLYHNYQPAIIAITIIQKPILTYQNIINSRIRSWGMVKRSGLALFLYLKAIEVYTTDFLKLIFMYYKSSYGGNEHSRVLVKPWLLNPYLSLKEKRYKFGINFKSHPTY